jgi:hypothetical protein
MQGRAWRRGRPAAPPRRPERRPSGSRPRPWARMPCCAEAAPRRVHRWAGLGPRSAAGHARVLRGGAMQASAPSPMRRMRSGAAHGAPLTSLRMAAACARQPAAGHGPQRRTAGWAGGPSEAARAQVAPASSGRCPTTADGQDQAGETGARPIVAAGCAWMAAQKRGRGAGTAARGRAAGAGREPRARAGGARRLSRRGGARALGGPRRRGRGVSRATLEPSRTVWAAHAGQAPSPARARCSCRRRGASSARCCGPPPLQGRPRRSVWLTPSPRRVAVWA